MIEIDWSKAPEWAEAHALYAFGGAIGEVWVGEKQYQLLDRPEPFPYGGGVGDTRHNPRRSWFKYATPRPKAWTGEGLPPVGLRCEAGIPHVSGPNNEIRSVIWIEGCVIAYHIIKGKTYAWFAEDDGFYPPGIFEFRPIRTPEQIAAEERAKAIDAMVAACPYPGSDCTRIDCEALYDANYRKQVQP